MDDGVALLDVAGWRVIEAPDLPAPGIMIRRYQILLIDSCLSDEDRAVTMDQAFARAIGVVA